MTKSEMAELKRVMDEKLTITSHEKPDEKVAALQKRVRKGWISRWLKSWMSWLEP